MKYSVLIILVLICYSCKQEKAERAPIAVDVTNDIVLPKHYIVPKTDEVIIIDGHANETAWKNATYSDKFIDIEGVKQPQFDTQIKMLWDDTHLYVFAEMEEPHIWGYLKQRDTIIFYNNDFEVFIDPFDSGISYGEIEINALNTVWDLFLDKPYRVGGNADFNWNLDDMKTAVTINGTLNEPSDIDSLWTVEMAIPLQPFVSMKHNAENYPKDGEQWRINFSRVEWDHDLVNGKYYRKKVDGNYLKEHNWVWSNQKVINMHEPEKWGFLQFNDSNSNDGIEYIEDADLTIKQTAFALFRKTRYGDLKYLPENETGFNQPLEVKYSKNQTVMVEFSKTNIGFEYKLESPLTKITYIINQEGILKTL